METITEYSILLQMYGKGKPHLKRMCGEYRGGLEMTMDMNGLLRLKAHMNCSLVDTDVFHSVQVYNFDTATHEY